MKMNKFLMATAAVAVFTAGVLSYTDAYAIDSTLTVDAVVVQAIDLDCTTVPLDFGNLDTAVAGVVTVTTAGARSSTGANLVGGGSEGAGGCDMEGDTGLLVDFQIDDTTLANTTTAGDTLAISNYTLAGAGVAVVDENNFDITLGAGSQNYTIGGDLTIAGAEAAGVYQGTTTITATYQ